ncbi:hypothetical protein CK203_049138 [Vitis vinifera]|uniref:Uncharacterized protein n=1 Tax=Vitis vinifera TaxID=29760 RepID=A0A438GV19_VITVI|nr:hypothetical protein CK203_049138 [Vitis vinifera]
MVFSRSNEQRVRFWKDRWCGDSPLCVFFPSLFGLAVDKEASGWLFGTPWQRGFRAGTLVSQDPLMIRRWQASWGGYMGRECSDVEDMVFWTKTKSGKFSVKSLYNALESGNHSLFPSSCIWNMQPKISFFVGEATWGKTLTLDLIQKRGGLAGIVFYIGWGCHGYYPLQLERLSSVGMVHLWAKSGLVTSNLERAGNESSLNAPFRNNICAPSDIHAPKLEQLQHPRQLKEGCHLGSPDIIKLQLGGLGFGSGVTDAPEIHSNGFHVKFDISEGQIGFVLPTVIPPCNVDLFRRLASSDTDQEDTDSWNTCIVLPFRMKLSKGTGMSNIISMFSDLHPSLLLFLHHLRCIKFKNMLNDSLIIMRKEIVGDGIIKVSHGREKMTWFVISQKLRADVIRPDVQTTEIAIAFTLQESDNGEYSPHFDQQPVFAFLPLRTYGLKFILQGDFVLPSSREEVDGDSPWNQWLLSEFPGLFVTAERSFCALPCFRENPGKSVAAYMSFVPLVGEVHGFFSSLPRMIISKLRMSNCLLLEGDNNEWVPPCKVLRSWNEQARSLLPDSLLRKHLGLGFLDKNIHLSDPLARALDGNYGSLDEGTIWLHSDSLSTELDASVDIPCMDMTLAENVTRMLHRIGVQQLSAHEIVQVHILPAMSDEGITNREKNLMIEYLSFVMVHLQSSCTNCRVEREYIISEICNKAFILTNHGYKRPVEVPIHFSKEFGNTIDVNRFINATNMTWHVVDIAYLKHPITESLSCGLMKWRGFFQALGVTDFVQIVQVEKNVSDISHMILKNEMWDRDLISHGTIAKDWESPELVQLLSILSKTGDQEAWIASSMDDELHYPKDLFYDSDEVHLVLGSSAPYALPKELVFMQG